MAQRHDRHGSEIVQDSFYGKPTLRADDPLREYLKVGATVLDVGCGPGSITVDIAEIVSPGKVIGIDVEQSSVDKATALADERRLANLSFQFGSAYELPFSADSFDLVYSHHVLEWLKDPPAGVSEMVRVARKGGVVAAQDVDYGGFLIHPPVPAFEE